MEYTRCTTTPSNAGHMSSVTTTDSSRTIPGENPGFIGPIVDRRLSIVESDGTDQCRAIGAAESGGAGHSSHSSGGRTWRMFCNSPKVIFSSSNRKTA